MITLTQPEGRQIMQGAETLLKGELPTKIVIEIMKRYESIKSQLDTDLEDGTEPTTINLDFPQFPMSLLEKLMPRITGVFLVGAMIKLFDLDS